jgi:hypothetical protein
MTDHRGYEDFPTHLAVPCYLLGIVIYALGAYVLSGFGLWLTIPYLIYCLWVEYRVLKESCTRCYYYGKVCGLARGKLCSLLFKQRVDEDSSTAEVTWVTMLPDAMVTIIPIAGGIVLLVRGFSWITLIALIVLAVLFLGGNAVVRGSFACKYCKQRTLGCPADRLFDGRAEA